MGAMVTEINAASCDPDKQTACTMDWSPVCATFTRTFSNRCVLESQLCALAQQGFEYNSRATRNRDCCRRPIPYMYWPQCGSDGVKYDNIWSLRVAGCANRDYITAVDDDTCGESGGDETTHDPILS